MQRQQVTLALLFLAGLGLTACSNRTTASGTNDGGGQADAPFVVDDAGNVVRDDAGNPIPVQQDAAAQDAGVVQSDAAQAQQDSGATPGVVQCGQSTCDAATQKCCVTQSGASCIDASATCTGLPVACDGPEDCSTDTPICCARLGGGGGNRGITCTTEADCRGERLCRLDTDCAQGDLCCGTGTLGNVTATWCLPQDQCPNTNPTTGVPCGTTSCDSPQVCCVTLNGQSCTAADACQQGLSLACDGPEDCASGTPVCCAEISMSGGSSTCVASDGCTTGGYSSGIVCHSNADCASGTCTALPMVNISVCR